MSTVTTPPSDFADWLSPMLVKELRQGLKTRVFVGVFILVQCVLVILLGFQLLAQTATGSRDMAQMLDVFLYIALGAAVLFLLPARGLSVIAEEAKANTLDLVHLTSLSATRIVWGKWLALVSQMLLLVVSVLPYALLRYFFGGVEIVSNLAIILSMVTSSMVITAGAIVLSTLPTGTRVVVIIAAIPGFMAIMGASAAIYSLGNFVTRSALSSSPWAFTIGVSVALTNTVLHCVYLLSLAASYIAQDSTNHAARKRVLGLVVAVIGLVLMVSKESELGAAWLFGTVIIWGSVILDALIESTSTIQSMYAPWAKRGLLGRMAGTVLYPGWATGLVFTFIMVTLGALMVVPNIHTWNGYRRQELFLGWGLAYLAIVAPCAVLVRFPNLRQRGWVYLFLQLIMLIWSGVLGILENTTHLARESIETLQAFTPTSAFMALGADSGQDHDHTALAAIGLPIGGLILCYLLVKAWREFKFMRWMEAGCPKRGSGV